MKNTLRDILKKVLSDTFLMYFKSHSYHWNVEGYDFIVLHEFFEDVYEELWEAVDIIAESIRTLDEYCPTTLVRILDNSEIIESENIPSTIKMLINLEEDNQKILETLKVALDLASEEGKEGIVDVLGSRISYHDKLGWMLRSMVKK